MQQYEVILQLAVLVLVLRLPVAAVVGGERASRGDGTELGSNCPEQRINLPHCVLLDYIQLVTRLNLLLKLKNNGKSRLPLALEDVEGIIDLKEFIRASCSPSFFLGFSIVDVALVFGCFACN